jgi:hypothetical protein
MSSLQQSHLSIDTLNFNILSALQYTGVEGDNKLSLESVSSARGNEYCH